MSEADLQNSVVTETAVPATATPQPVTIVQESKPEMADTMGEVWDKLNPTRDTTGKFKPAKPEPVKAEGAETSDTAAPVTDQEPAAKTVEPAKPTINRPQSWSSDLDEWWSSLPPDRQDFLAKRETEATRKISELGRAAEVSRSFQPYMEPLNAIAQQVGAPVPEVIKNFIAADEFLRRDPHGAIQWLAQTYGANLSQFGQAPQGDQAPESEHVRALTQQIDYLKRSNAEIASRISARERREVEAQTQSLASLVDEFSKGKESYWGDIEGEVVAQIRAIRDREPNADPKEVLQKAHDRAVKLNDEVSNRLTEAKRKEEAAKKAADDRRKADEAKRLASLNTKTSKAAPQKSGKLDMAAEMADIYDKMSAA